MNRPLLLINELTYRLYIACKELLHVCADQDEDFFNANKKDVIGAVKAVEYYERINDETFN